MTVQSALGGRLYPQAGPVASARRVRALIRRHAYLLLKSWPRLVSMAYYPTVTMVLWAFLTIYLKPTTSFLQDAPGFFIGEAAGDAEAFIVGGAELYRESLSRANRLYLTRVRASVEGDTTFPDVEWNNWQLVESEDHDANEKNEHAYRFETYDRR